MPQMSIGSVSHAAAPIQCGISNLPLSTKHTPIRFSSPLAAPRHLSRRRNAIPRGSSHPKNVDPRVPFFCVEEDIPSAPKADAFFLPSENPRALIIQSIESRHGRSHKRTLSENNGHGWKQSP